MDGVRPAIATIPNGLRERNLIVSENNKSNSGMKRYTLLANDAIVLLIRGMRDGFQRSSIAMLCTAGVFFVLYRRSFLLSDDVLPTKEITSQIFIFCDTLEELMRKDRKETTIHTFDKLIAIAISSLMSSFALFRCFL
jgi:hypothetical protein